MHKLQQFRIQWFFRTVHKGFSGVYWGSVEIFNRILHSNWVYTSELYALKTKLGSGGFGMSSPDEPITCQILELRIAPGWVCI